MQEAATAGLQQVQEAVHLVLGAFGPWMAHHFIPAALQAGLGLHTDVLPAALRALMVWISAL